VPVSGLTAGPIQSLNKDGRWWIAAVINDILAPDRISRQELPQ
jgi:hypothetical protein